MSGGSRSESTTISCAPGTVAPIHSLPSCIAITGAGGFIGGRLVELLRREPWVGEVRGFSRHRDRDNQTMLVRLNDEAAVREALIGCHALVNCAFDFQNMGSNLEIAQVVGRACAAAGIKLVHISTAAIYEPLPNGELDELQPALPTDPYKRVKVAIEEQLQRYTSELALDLVILQPTIVYGPAGRAWTDSPVRELLMGGIALPDEGRGLCNAVYVDDVCRAAIRALTTNVPPGERFLINGPTPVEWREFLGSYDRMVGGRCLQLLPSVQTDSTIREPERAAAESSARRWRRIILERAIEAIKRLVISRLSAKTRSDINMALRYLRARLGRRRTPDPTDSRLALYSARCSIRIDKARALLNYTPEFDLERGMAATKEYVQRTYAEQIARRARQV